MGLTAVAALVAIGWVLPLREERGFPAVVRAARTFTLASIEPGHYLWSLREGRTPGGNGLVCERVLVFDRTELVEVAVGEELRTGVRVAPGQRVATVRSLRTVRERDELAARRQSLSARRDLLLAGERDAAVREAEQRVALAEAEHRAARSQLDRLRALAEQGLASEAELEGAEDEDEVRRQAVALARAGVALVRSAARPEAVAEVEAALREVDASLVELDARTANEEVTSPIGGLVELGGAQAELRVMDVDEVYLAIAVPASLSWAIEVGAPVRFTTPSFPDAYFEGEVVAVGASAVSTTTGDPVVWASAHLPEPHGVLHDGIRGEAMVGERRSVWSRVRDGWDR